jgi:nuclear cap-binding protein subunit 1
MIVEVMFSELFHLPNPSCLEIAYGSILIELCKLQPSTMPQVLAQATELLYERIDTMNVTCFDRLDQFFLSLKPLKLIYLLFVFVRFLTSCL